MTDADESAAVANGIPLAVATEISVRIVPTPNGSQYQSRQSWSNSPALAYYGNPPGGSATAAVRAAA